MKKVGKFLLLLCIGLAAGCTEEIAFHFEANGGSGTPMVITLEPGEKLVFPSNPFTYDGFVFTGWSTHTDGAPQYKPEDTLTVSSSATYYALWEAETKTVTISFHPNEGTGTMKPETVSIGTSLKLPMNTFTRSGFSFTGWALQSNGEVVYNDQDQIEGISASITLYAVWTAVSALPEPQQGILAFHANGGSGTMAALTGLSDGDETALPENRFSKPGYRFIGWSTSADGEAFYNDRQPNFGYYFSVNPILYAVWAAESEAKTLSFEANGGSGTMNPIYFLPRQQIIIPEITFTPPQNEGTLLGLARTRDGAWEYSQGGGFKSEESTVLYCIWKTESAAVDPEPPAPQTYTVSFNPNGGQGTMNPITVEAGAPVTLPPNTFTKENASFKGWALSADAISALYGNGSSIPPITADTQLFAVWGDPSEWAHKICWVYGVNAPDFPGIENIKSYSRTARDIPPGEWMRYDDGEELDFEDQKLPWKEGCGWYDCNKTYEFDNAEDGSMCWAAGTSNLLHWWLNNNADYISRYDRIDPHPYSFTVRPSAEWKAPRIGEPASNKSEIFKFYIDVFEDRSGWQGKNGGPDWFVTGNAGNIQAPMTEPQKWSSFKGFFPKVFGSNDHIAEETKNIGKENFNEWIKRAFTEKKAIGFVVAYEGQHAVTMWGAEFDGDGYVSYIYYADNNFGSSDTNESSLSRKAVLYKDHNYTTDAAIMASLPGPVSGRVTESPITALILIDLKQDVWEQRLSALEQSEQ